MIRVLFLLLLLIPNFAFAQEKEKLDISQWKTLPILHEGRVKPLDSFARLYLKTFSDQDQIDGLSAAQWLAESVFLPEKAMQRKIFQFRNKDEKRETLTYPELSNYIQNKKSIIDSLIEKNSNDLSPDQIALMTLYENFILHTQLLRSMTGFIISPEKQKVLMVQIQKIISEKGDDIEKYSDSEKEIAAKAFAIQTLANGAENNVLFRVIKKDEEWLSPWSVIQRNSTVKTIPYWQNMAQAYRAHDAKRWNEAIQNAQTKNIKLKTEVLFNTLSLHHVSAFLYGMTILFFLLSCFIKPVLFEKISFYSLSIGVASNFIHMALRIYILGRPPIGTLYESILFVALICSGGYAFMAWRQKNPNCLLLGGLAGLLLLLTAESFAAEDTMGTLVAVLNTNFWLLTHVICITMGYGLCLLTSLTAHYYLLQKIRNKEIKDIFTTVKTLSLFSLFLVTVGTILGGLWADQSWGRFWGWDPKENGAMLIALWLIWVLHGHLTSHITRTGFIIGMAFVSIVVVLAWFGVNLLNVGLHSYGFISGVAWGIGLFCAFETLTIVGLWLYPKWKTR